METCRVDFDSKQKDSSDQWLSGVCISCSVIFSVLSRALTTSWPCRYTTLHSVTSPTLPIKKKVHRVSSTEKGFCGEDRSLSPELETYWTTTKTHRHHFRRKQDRVRLQRKRKSQWEKDSSDATYFHQTSIEYAYEWISRLAFFHEE